MYKHYNVTLEKEVVDKAKKIAKKEGAKLSPILNMLLLKWVISKE